VLRVSFIGTGKKKRKDYGKSFLFLQRVEFILDLAQHTLFLTLLNGKDDNTIVANFYFVKLIEEEFTKGLNFYER